ncbi:hypothetical protein OROGR_021717 [Orobanche gracilis]
MYFKMIKSFPSTSQNLFNPHSTVVEVLCNHFILSFSNEQAFGDLLSRLFCTHAMELQNPLRTPSLSINATVSLLLSPIMVSIPKYMLAHLISIFYEAVYYTKNSKPDRKLTNCFLSTFEKSINLYTTHMSCLEKDGFPISPKGFKASVSHGFAYPGFEFYLSQETKSKIARLITKLDNSRTVPDDFSFRMKSDLVSSSLRFVKESLNVYDISSQDEILAILSCLVLKASESHGDKEIQPIEDATMQHLYLLASVLKLMGISLLRAISCFRHNKDDSSCPKTLKDFASCKEYDFISDTISCFEDFDIGLPLQKDLANVMLSCFTRHIRSKMMFLHFSGLMSLSFGSGLDCLVKACLFVILVLLNLFVFEDGNLDAFQSMIDSNEACHSSGLSVVRLQETEPNLKVSLTVVDQNSSLVVASKFHKVRSLYSSVLQKANENETQSLQTLASASSNMEAVEGLEEEEETEETSNGEIYLKYVLKMGETNSDFDDLVDFVECKQGKDYSDWLKNRGRYRKRKLEKMAVLRWKKKKKTWKTLKPQRN